MVLIEWFLDDSDAAGTYDELAQNAKLRRREAYEAPWWDYTPYKIFADWVDRTEWPGDDNTGYRIVSAFDIMVREIGFYVQGTLPVLPRVRPMKKITFARSLQAR